MYYKTIFFLLNDVILASNNNRFTWNLFKTNIKTNHDNWDNTRNKKLQYHVNREAAKISALLSGKVNIYEYFRSEEILPSDQSKIIEQAKFTDSPLGKALEKHTKTIEEAAKKQTIKTLKMEPEDTPYTQTKN